MRAMLVIAAFGMVGAKCSCTPTSPSKAKCDAPVCTAGQTRVCQDLCVTPGKFGDACSLDPCSTDGTGVCALELVCLPVALGTTEARFC